MSEFKEMQSAAAPDSETSRERSRRWWLGFMSTGFLLSAFAAVPTVMDLAKAAGYGINYSKVRQAEEQKELWQKNFDCAMKGKAQAVSTPEGTTVQVRVCPNGDVLIEVVPAKDRRVLQWIALEKLQTAGMNLGMAGLRAGDEARPERPVQTIQGGLRIICQGWADRTKIKRVTDEGGRCFLEAINVLTGRVEQRREVPCNTPCQ